MNLPKIFSRFTFLFLTFFLLSAPVFAVEVAPNGGTLVATVNFQDAKITSQQGNTFNIAFSLTNREGVQKDVQYGIQLISETAKGKFVVDEKVFGEKLTLAENSSVRKGISYTAPAMLGGTYQLLLTSKNAAGFPFAFYPLGKVTITQTVKGVQISPDTCQIKTDKNAVATSISSMAILASGAQTLELNCLVTNTANAVVSATPILQTNLNGSYGETVETTKMDMTHISHCNNGKNNLDRDRKSLFEVSILIFTSYKINTHV